MDKEFKSLAKQFIEAVVRAEEQYQTDENFDGVLDLLNAIYYSVPDETYERFAGIIQAAGDSEMRCPK